MKTDSEENSGVFTITISERNRAWAFICTIFIAGMIGGIILAPVRIAQLQQEVDGLRKRIDALETAKESHP
jgi:hypothetical protein